MEFTPEKLLGGAFAVGLLAACWSRIKFFSHRLLSLLIVHVRVEEDAGNAVRFWCWTNLARTPFGDRRYCAFTDYVRPVKRYQVIGYETVGTDPIVFWRGWRPLLVGLKSQGENSASLGYSVTLTFLRWTFDVDVVVADAIDALNHHRHAGSKAGRFYVQRVFGSGRRQVKGYGDSHGGNPSDADESGQVLKANSPTSSYTHERLLRWQREDIGAEKEADPWGALAFPDQIQELIIETRRWLESEQWHRSKRIQWRRGYLLYGSPGTGKTSLARAIAQDLDLPVFAFDLASLSNREFTNAWRKLMNNVPCMALLEDIDAVFAGRENRLGEEGGGLTFDCLLNCLSGIESADGVLVIVTTNRLEELDPALGVPDGKGGSTRPGRIDRAVELPTLDDECRRRLAERILADCPWEVDRLVAEGAEDTGARFQDRCAKVALAHFWSHGNNGNQPPRLLLFSDNGREE